jgi:hypothetical protein
MAEFDWATATDPEEMLRRLKRGHRPTSRKLRLFACACCREGWHLLSDPRLRTAVEVAERFEDGLEDVEALNAAERAAEIAYHGDRFVEEECDPSTPEEWAAAAVCILSQRSFPSGPEDADEVAHRVALALSPDQDEPDSEVRAVQAALLRDVLGQPDRIRPLQASWRTASVVALAKEIYDDRAFDRLPILADALEDTVCDDSEVLNHCRSVGRHVRGCWVLDLVLGKSWGRRTNEVSHGRSTRRCCFLVAH